MVKTLYIIVLSCLAFISDAQNLVINPSFEDTVSKDMSGTPYYEICKDWVNPTIGTSDYFSPFGIALGWWPWVSPASVLGYQNAQDGVAYIGLDTYEPGRESKEYAEGKLTKLLERDHLYCVSLYVNRLDSANYTNCDLEISFSNVQVKTLTLSHILFTDTVKFNLSDVDTVSWFCKKAIYKAKGGERYIYIGSLIPNLDSICIGIGSPGNFTQNAYYLIDNVSITDCTDSLINFNFPNIFTPNGDGINDYVSFDQLSEFTFQFNLYNRWGNIVYSNSESTAVWDGRENNGNRLSDGIYFYTLSFSVGDNRYPRSGFIHIKN